MPRGQENTAPVEPQEPDYVWQNREQDKFYSGEYQEPVWKDERFWRAYRHCRQFHYVHVSPKDPGMLLYVQSTEKGRRGIHTPIKAGRYLKKFFGDYLSDKEIKF